tara:strand:- start:192 stop:413 length:222 start_codon:yes stop_codon:yes gene_type:complete
MKITKSRLKQIIKEELETAQDNNKPVIAEGLSDKNINELKKIKEELIKASNMHKSQAERIQKMIDQVKSDKKN